jgi:hypothetical protein
MAAAIVYKSDQLTNALASPPVLNPAVDRGSSQKWWFSKTLTVAMVAASPDSIQLLSMPKGYRFMGGVIVNNDADMEMDMGDGTTIDAYGNNLGADADAPKAFGNTIALLWGSVLTVDTILTASAVTADGAIGTIIRGYVELIVPGR